MFHYVGWVFRKEMKLFELYFNSQQALVGRLVDICDLHCYQRNRFRNLLVPIGIQGNCCVPRKNIGTKLKKFHL